MARIIKKYNDKEFREKLGKERYLSAKCHLNKYRKLEEWEEWEFLRPNEKEEWIRFAFKYYV